METKQFGKMQYQDTESVSSAKESHLDKVIRELQSLSKDISSNILETNQIVKELGGYVLLPENKEENIESPKYDGKIGCLFEVVKVLEDARQLSRNVNRQLEIMI